MLFWIGFTIIPLAGLVIAALGYGPIYRLFFGHDGGSDDAPDTWTASSRD